MWQLNCEIQAAASYFSANLFTPNTQVFCYLQDVYVACSQCYDFVFHVDLLIGCRHYPQLGYGYKKIKYNSLTQKKWTVLSHICLNKCVSQHTCNMPHIAHKDTLYATVCTSSFQNMILNGTLAFLSHRFSNPLIRAGTIQF